MSKLSVGESVYASTILSIEVKVGIAVTNLSPSILLLSLQNLYKFNFAMNHKKSVKEESKNKRLREKNVQNYYLGQVKI